MKKKPRCQRLYVTLLWKNTANSSKMPHSLLALTSGKTLIPSITLEEHSFRIFFTFRRTAGRKQEVLRSDWVGFLRQELLCGTPPSKGERANDGEKGTMQTWTSSRLEEKVRWVLKHNAERRILTAGCYQSWPATGLMLVGWKKSSVAVLLWRKPRFNTSWPADPASQLSRTILNMLLQWKLAKLKFLYKVLIIQSQILQFSCTILIYNQ